MNAPSPTSPRVPAPPMDANSTVHAGALVVVARAPAANADAAAAISNSTVNPLWMITAGLAIFFAAIVILVSTS